MLSSRYNARMVAREAVSPVVATVIVTSIMLTAVAVAVYFSTSLIDAHRQMMEYESAKELLTYAATALEQVALGAGGARYVRFSLTSTGLNFEQTPYKLQVLIGDQEQLSIDLRRVSVCAGPLVTTVERVLYPEGGRLEDLRNLTVGAGEPIVVVYESFKGQTCAFLEPRRVRAIYSGVTYSYEDGQQVPYNFYTIHIINLTFGKLGGSGIIPLVIRSRGVTVEEYRFRSPAVTIQVRLGEIRSRRTLTGAANARGSVVIVKISQVEVSTG